MNSTSSTITPIHGKNFMSDEGKINSVRRKLLFGNDDDDEYENENGFRNIMGRRDVDIGNATQDEILVESHTFISGNTPLSNTTRQWSSLNNSTVQPITPHGSMLSSSASMSGGSSIKSALKKSNSKSLTPKEVRIDSPFSKENVSPGFY